MNILISTITGLVIPIGISMILVGMGVPSEKLSGMTLFAIPFVSACMMSWLEKE